ncbi:MAG: hypothetical protein AB1427_00835 [Thermodesulfobacteriota bacterium]
MIEQVKPFYHYWQFWLQMVQLIGIVVIGIYTWWTNREKVNASRFESLEKDVAKRVTDTALKELNDARESRCAAHLDRTAKLELAVSLNRASIESLPDDETIDALHGRITDVAKGLSGLGGKIDAVAHTVDLIHEWILKGGKK